ncbi:hypothetical protein BDR07DRAFT_1416489 [Suillus spraguei]|nr:hypothetical protein BDR07DRAFT_1416489 [Suillus spraguei]
MFFLIVCLPVELFLSLNLVVLFRQVLERRGNFPGPAKNDYCNEAKLPAHTPTLVSPTFISVDLHVHIALHCTNKLYVCCTAPCMRYITFKSNPVPRQMSVRPGDTQVYMQHRPG